MLISSFTLLLKDKINITNILARQEWSPADFLFRKATFVEDYSVAIKRIYLAIPGNTTSVKSIDLAMQNYYNHAINYFNSLDNRVKGLLNSKWWFGFEYFPDSQPTNVEFYYFSCEWSPAIMVHVGLVKDLDSTTGILQQKCSST